MSAFYIKGRGGYTIGGTITFRDLDDDIFGLLCWSGTEAKIQRPLLQNAVWNPNPGTQTFAPAEDLGHDEYKVAEEGAKTGRSAIIEEPHVRGNRGGMCVP